MRTFKDVIDAFTVKGLAEALGLPESHVRTMRARDSIPPEYWPAMISMAPDELKDWLSFESLLSIRKSSFGRDRATEAAE